MYVILKYLEVPAESPEGVYGPFEEFGPAMRYARERAWNRFEVVKVTEA